MSQVGATVTHKTLARCWLTERSDRRKLSTERWGDTDFLNMLEEERLVSKRESKTSAVAAMIPTKFPEDRSSDYIPFLNNKKICYIGSKEDTLVIHPLI